MKIISWNCNGKFREKFKDIIKEDADIYVVQECEDPALAKSDEYKDFAGDNYFWTGKSKDKGLGIFAKDEVTLEEIPDITNTEFRNFIALRVNDSFNLLGVWAMPPYVEMIHNYFDENTPLFNESLIMCGDFNSNSIWDKEHRTKDNEGNAKDQTNLNRKLESCNLISVYHELNDEKQGKESENTFYLYRHLDKPYHIDYVYACPSGVEKYEILDADEWISLSDHMPIAFEFAYELKSRIINATIQDKLLAKEKLKEEESKLLLLKEQLFVSRLLIKLQFKESSPYLTEKYSSIYEALAFDDTFTSYDRWKDSFDDEPSIIDLVDEYLINSSKELIHDQKSLLTNHISCIKMILTCKRDISILKEDLKVYDKRLKSELDYINDYLNSGIDPYNIYSES
jgi:exonuclease III